MTDDKDPVTRATLADNTSASFMVERSHHGMPVMALDLQRFAHALAEALTTPERFARVVLSNDEDARIMLSGAPSEGHGLVLIVSTDRPSPQHNGKALIWAVVNDAPELERSLPHMPILSVSTARPIKSLAQDIVRRVIKPSVGPASRVRNMVTENYARRQRLDQTIAALEVRFPKLQFKKSGDGLSAEINITRLAGPSVIDTFYLWGRIDDTGRFALDRVATFTPDLLVDFLALIHRHFPERNPTPQVTVESLLDLLRPYVSADDIGVDQDVFLGMVADRIKNDLSGS